MNAKNLGYTKTMNVTARLVESEDPLSLGQAKYDGATERLIFHTLESGKVLEMKIHSISQLEMAVA